MPLNEQDARLLELLASDPAARRELVKHGARLMPDHPVVRQEASTSTAFDDKVKPLQEKIEELEKELKNKDGRDLLHARRSEVTGAPFYFNEAQVKELEERMMKDGDGNLYGSYAAAARYYQYQDQPTHPAGGPTGITPFGRRTKEEENWRSMIKDPKSRLWKDRKNLMREQWEAGSAELSKRTR
jgi:hypothetical protein